MKLNILVILLYLVLSNVHAYSTIQTSYSPMAPQTTPMRTTMEYTNKIDFTRTSQTADHSSRSNLSTLKPKEVTNAGDLSNTGRVMVRAMSGAGVAVPGPGGSRDTGGSPGITIKMDDSLSVG